MKAERFLSLARDAVSICTGAGGIAFLLSRNPPILDAIPWGAFMALLAGPTVAGLWQLRPTAGASDTPASGSPSPPPSSAQPSSSTSTSSP